MHTCSAFSAASMVPLRACARCCAAFISNNFTLRKPAEQVCEFFLLFLPKNG